VDENTLAADSRKVRVTSSGLFDEPQLTPAFMATAVAGGRLFGPGSINDAASLEPLHSLTEIGAALPLPEQNRIYYLHLQWDRSKSREIRVYDWKTLRVIGAIPFRREDQPSEMVACGSDCIAVRSQNAISIVSTAAIEFAAKDRPAEREGDGWRMRLRVNRLLFDARDNRLLATTTPDNGHQGNSLLTIRPSDGAIEQSIWVGTDPAPMALSEDGARVYVGLRGERAVVEADLAAATSRKVVMIPKADPEDDRAPGALAFRPGTLDGLAASVYSAGRQPRVVLFEGAKMLPRFVQGVHDYIDGEDIYFTGDNTRLQVIGTQ
jgi:hypothetical protein